MKQIPVTARMDTIGRVLISKAIRDEYGIDPGDLITIWIDVEEKTEKKSTGAKPCKAPETLPASD